MTNKTLNVSTYCLNYGKDWKNYKSFLSEKEISSVGYLNESTEREMKKKFRYFCYNLRMDLIVITHTKQNYYSKVIKLNTH